MSLVFKRILLVTHNVQFAIDTKRALESLGEYEVTTVTDANNAIRRLQNQPHNLVILDVENLAIPSFEMIRAIRQIQNEIAIILAPDLPDVNDLAVIADVQGVVDIPVPVRTLIPIVESSVRDVFDNLPETAKAPAVDVSQETIYIETLVDELIADDDVPYFTKQHPRAHKIIQLPADVEDVSTQETSAIEVLIESNSEGKETARFVPPTGDDRSLQLFRKLANEEPPMPGFAESGTVSDLARSVTQSRLQVLMDDDDQKQLEETVASEEELERDESDDSSAAILVLRTALDETTPIEAISLKKLFDNIRERLPEDKQSIQPLPSWLKEGEKFVREPGFLPDDLPSLDSQRPVEYTSTLTEMSDREAELPDPATLDTEQMEANDSYDADKLHELVDLSRIAIERAEASHDDESQMVEDETPDVTVTEDEFLLVEEDGSVETEDIQSVPPMDDIQLPEETEEDAFLAQMAVTLTQVTTELTAEATILTRDNVIVAYSGEMPIEDIEDIRMIIHDDWQASRENSRIRFITLPGSGYDYMLYSKGTVGGFTLSMAFSGTKQLRMIRRQGERLLSALESVVEPAEDVTLPPVEENQPQSDMSSQILVEAPIEEATPIVDDVPQPETVLETVPEENADEVESPVDVGPKHPFTFIWLIDDMDVQLSDRVAKQLVFWLEVQLNGMYWTIHQLNVHDTFIYLRADVPGETSPASLIRDLMERSTRIALSEDESLPENLWADAYLVLTPGRDMTEKEIQRFMDFARDEL